MATTIDVNNYYDYFYYYHYDYYDYDFDDYSKNPHKRTSGLRTLRLEFAQKDTICIRTHLA